MTHARALPLRGSDAVDGRYRLIEVIGEGGMGRVWLAEDELLQRRVAIKEIETPPDVTPDPGTVREARAAARLHHPNVVKIFNVLWWGGRSWIVMEHVESRSLHQVVRDDGTLSHRAAARVGLQMLAALRAAHQAGVLHRDVKPHNVLVCPDGRVVLTDFGLATTDPERTTNPAMGSPFFVAPESLGTAPAGPAADLWSLGATLYAATEGRPPFARPSTTAALVAVVTDEPDPPQRTGPFMDILLDLLVKDPAARPSAADLESRLRRAADAAIGVARPVTAVHLPPPDRSDAEPRPSARGVARPLGPRLEAPSTDGDGWRGRAVVPAPTSRNAFDH